MIVAQMGDEGTSRGDFRWTYRPLDEKHADRTHYGHISNQRLQNHPHHPM